MKQIKLVNMTKADMVNEIETINQSVADVTKKTTKADITAIIESETLHPKCFENETDIQALMHNLCTMVAGTKEFTPKNGGSVCKYGRKRVFELYSCTDYRIHMYAPFTVIEKIAKTYKGFAVHNDKWLFTDRFEFTKVDFIQFANDCLLADDYSVIAEMVNAIR